MSQGKNLVSCLSGAGAGGSFHRASACCVECVKKVHEIIVSDYLCLSTSLDAGFPPILNLVSSRDRNSVKRGEKNI